MSEAEHQISLSEWKAQEIPTPQDVFLDAAPTAEIQAAFLKHRAKFQEGYYKKIMVSVSGGADSDRMMDLIERIGYEPGTVEYHYYDTGIEYQATKNHIKELEAKYGVIIHSHKAKMPVPLAVRKYGLPFISKKFSTYIYRLQKHGFQWEDKPFDALYAEYPRCKAALRWWCNEWGEGSRNNISRRRWLKEFMVENPPDFPISDFCCQKAKKDTAHAVAKVVNPDLSVQGIRKAEGGARSIAYSGCFDDVEFGCSKLRPLFWFVKSDCEAYDAAFGVEHSECYQKYGLDRTGCACCPFGKYWAAELEAARKYEPKLYIAANNIFGKSYEYTRKYYEYRDRRNKETREADNGGVD